MPAQRISRGGLTEWLRSLIGNQVRRNSPVGSSPMSSAIEARDLNDPGLFSWPEIGYSRVQLRLPQLEISEREHFQAVEPFLRVQICRNNSY